MESSVVIHDTFTLVLVSPAKRITISNALLFIKNEALAKELSRFGQLVSLIKMVSLGCKSPLLKHVVYHQRQVYMLLKDNTSDLNLSCNFKIDGFGYMVFTSCPERLSPEQTDDQAVRSVAGHIDAGLGGVANETSPGRASAGMGAAANESGDSPADIRYGRPLENGEEQKKHDGKQAETTESQTQNEQSQNESRQTQAVKKTEKLKTQYDKDDVICHMIK